MDRWQILLLTAIMAMLVVAVLGMPGIANATQTASHSGPQANLANYGSTSENGSAGFFGIGTNTPTRILTVTGTGPGTVPWFQRGTDSAGFIIERTPDNRWVLGVNESPALGKGFVLSTYPVGAGSSTPRLMVDLDGRIGVNTVSPYGGARLHVVNDNTTTGARAVYGVSNASNTHGVYGESTDGNGVYGRRGADGPYGYLGGNRGAYGEDKTSGNYGYLGGPTNGVYGQSTSSRGVYGTSTSSTGVGGYSTTWYGVWGQSAGGTGVYGTNNSGNYGYLGDNNTGVYGRSENITGVIGSSFNGTGVYGESTNGLAGDFHGNVNITGNLTQSGGNTNLGNTTVNGLFNAMAPPIPAAVSFFLPGTSPVAAPGSFIVFPPNPQFNPDAIVLNDNTTVYGSFTVIGGPKLFSMQDPTNPSKTINYACIEGPEAGNYMRGSAELVNGKATILLPEHFGKVTAEKGLTVQLTPVGKWLQLYVAEQSTSRIVIAEATGQSGNCSYLVQGVRKGYEDFQVVRDRQNTQ